MSATAVFSVIATGGFIAVSHNDSGTMLDAANADPAAADLVSDTEPLVLQPVSAHTSAVESRRTAASSGTAKFSTATSELLLAALPGERTAAVDNHDVEMLHKAEHLADEAAAAHAAAREAFLISGGGGLDEWINVALTKLHMPQSLAPGIRAIVMRESRGNPFAVNHTDSNALAGRPSQGLMQTIPSTFRAYVLPELAHLPITNPVANITAGVRYMIAHYGLSTLMAGGRFDSAGNYLGY